MAVFCILRAVGTDAGLGNIAIAVQIAARNPKADAFADRQIDHAVHIEPVIVAITAGQRALPNKVPCGPFRTCTDCKS